MKTLSYNPRWLELVDGAEVGVLQVGRRTMRQEPGLLRETQGDKSVQPSLQTQ